MAKMIGKRLVHQSISYLLAGATALAGCSLDASLAQRRILGDCGENYQLINESTYTPCNANIAAENLEHVCYDLSGAEVAVMCNNDGTGYRWMTSSTIRRDGGKDAGSKDVGMDRYVPDAHTPICTEGEQTTVPCPEGLAGRGGVLVCQDNDWRGPTSYDCHRPSSYDGGIPDGSRDAGGRNCIENETLEVPCSGGLEGVIRFICNMNMWATLNNTCHMPSRDGGMDGGPVVPRLDYVIAQDPLSVTGEYDVSDRPSIKVYVRNSSTTDANLAGDVCTTLRVANGGTVAFEDGSASCSRLEGLLRSGESREVRSQEVGFSDVGLYAVSGTGGYNGMMNGNMFMNNGELSGNLNVAQVPWVVFVRGEENEDRALDTRRIWLVKANGLGERRLTDNDFAEFSPEWYMEAPETVAERVMYIVGRRGITSFGEPNEDVDLKNIINEEVIEPMFPVGRRVDYALSNNTDGSVMYRQLIDHRQTGLPRDWPQLNIGNWHSRHGFSATLQVETPDITDISLTAKTWSQDGQLVGVGITYRELPTVYIVEDNWDIINGDSITDHVMDVTTDPRVYIYQRPGLSHGLQFSGNSTVVFPALDTDGFRFYSLDLSAVYQEPRGEAVVTQLTPTPIADTTDRIKSFVTCGSRFGYIVESDQAGGNVDYHVDLFDQTTGLVDRITTAGNYFKEGLSCDSTGSHLVYGSVPTYSGNADTLDRTRVNVEMVVLGSTRMVDRVYQLTTGNTQGSSVRVQVVR